MRNRTVIALLLLTTASIPVARAAPPDIEHASIDELKKRDAALDKEKATIQKRLKELSHRQGGAFERGAAKLFPNPPDKPAAEPEKTSFCNQDQRLFIRADSLDNFLYTASSVENATGASVTYTNDMVAKTGTLAVNGQVSYVLFRDLCPETPKQYIPFVSGWAVVPFISASGNMTSPRAKSEESSTRLRSASIPNSNWRGASASSATFRSARSSRSRLTTRRISAARRAPTASTGTGTRTIFGTIWAATSRPTPTSDGSFSYVARPTSGKSMYRV
jgi:hypothetical protein